MVPNSSQIKRPQNERIKPITHNMREAPTEPTEPKMELGVEKIPVPMIRPTLSWQVGGVRGRVTRKGALTSTW